MLSPSLDNQAIGTIGETVVRLALTSLGANLEPHEVWEGGADIKGTLNGVSLAFEVNDWYGGYFHPNRYDSIQSNLANTKATYQIHFSMGVKPTAEQYAESSELGIISIHYPQQVLSINQSIVTAVRSLIVSALHLNPYTTFYKVRCVDSNHSTTDGVLLQYIQYTSNVLNTALNESFSPIHSKINRSCDTALTKFLSELKCSNKSCLDSRSKSKDTTVCKTTTYSTIPLDGCDSKAETFPSSAIDSGVQPSVLEFSPSTQYYLVTADSEYSFTGSMVSENYVESQWNSTIANFPMPKVTVILVTSEMLTNIASGDSYCTPLMPQMDSYLILVTFKDNQQFKESLRSEFARIWADGYVASLHGEELLNFQQIIEEKAKSTGGNAPKLLPNNSIYY
jgi:hypothetical protein